MAITRGKLKRGTLGKGLKTTRVMADIPNNELPEIVLEKTMEDTMRQFVRFTQEKFEKTVWKMDVRHSGDLLESFSNRISLGSGRISGQIRFNFYGRFVDMGVGNGMTLMERQTGRALTNNRNPSRITRKPKTWFTSVWLVERGKLSGILARDVARASGENLAGILPDGEIALTI